MGSSTVSAPDLIMAEVVAVPTALPYTLTEADHLILLALDARNLREHKHCNACNALPRYARRCMGCRNARYCGTVCQRLHWPTHRAECQQNAPTMQARYDARQSCKNCRLLSPVAFRCDGCEDQARAPWYCSQLCRSSHLEIHAAKNRASVRACGYTDLLV
jgi:hypothetical protein